MGSVVVRVGLDSDLVAAAGLRWSWIIEENGGSSVLPREAFVVEFSAWAQAHSATHQYFVAVVDDLIVGMAWLAVLDRVPSPRSVNRQSGDMQSVYVLPAFRGQGIGACLINEVVEAASQRGAERLTVHSSPDAVGSYARAGLEATDLLRSRSLNPVS